MGLDQAACTVDGRGQRLIAATHPAVPVPVPVGPAEHEARSTALLGEFGKEGGPPFLECRELSRGRDQERGFG
jgi:hypothetical protein